MTFGRLLSDALIGRFAGEGRRVKNIWLGILLAAACAAQTRLHLETQARRTPAISLLADFTVTTTGNTVNVTGGKARIGATVYTLVGGSCTLSGALGDVKVYISDTGNLMCVGEPGMSATVSGSAVFATVTFPRYPVGCIPLSDLTWTGSTLTVDSDDRAFISNVGTSAGLGISVLEAGGVANVNIDQATVPLLAGANNFIGNNDFTGATRTAPHRTVTSDPPNCTVGDTIFNTTLAQVKYCVATNVWQGLGTAALLTSNNTWTASNDFGSATRTAPNRLVSSDPATCTVGDSIFNTSQAQLKLCAAANTWQSVGTLLLPANNAWTGSNDFGGATRTVPNRLVSSDPGTCAVGDSIFNTTLAQVRFCVAPNTWQGLGASSLLASNNTWTGTNNWTGSNAWTGSTDFGGATRTVPSRLVSSDPATCALGDAIFNTAAAQMKVCIATNTWQAVGSGGGGGGGFDRQFAAAKCQNTVAGAAFTLPATNAPTAVCQTGTNTTDYATLDWDDVPTKNAFDFVLLPNGSLPTIRVDVGWSTSATTGTVNWRIATACVVADPDPAYNADQTISGTAAAVANRITKTTLASLTLTGCSAGQQMRFRISRDTADTVTATARLHYLRIYQ